jgi:hypothetical protein
MDLEVTDNTADAGSLPSADAAPPQTGDAGGSMGSGGGGPGACR